jgi:2-oxoglutarate ferredoxin oxidoreductase subunit gamma
MNRFRKEFRLSGSGGQGLILAGLILARAATKQGYRVTQTQSYGPESRGGSSRADVVISNNEIYFPEAQNFDYLVALTQEACDKYLYDLKEDGLLIIDSGLVKNLGMTVNNIVELNLSELTLQKLGSSMPVNVVSLALITEMSDIICEKSLEHAIKESFSPALVDMNLKAMKLGFELGKSAKK